MNSKDFGLSKWAASVAQLVEHLHRLLIFVSGKKDLSSGVAALCCIVRFACTVLHRKRQKTTFFNILCTYSVMVHGSGTSFISN